MPPYSTTFSDGYAWCKLDGRVVGKFHIDDFLLHVISPLEFSRYEKNPDKRNFQIRKIDFDIFNTFKPQHHDTPATLSR